MNYSRTRKSQIAIEYWYRFRERHARSHIIWIHASTKERFEQAFKGIARKCEIPGWDDPATNSLDLVYDWLSGDSAWLMILDNADDKGVFFGQQQATTSQGPNIQRPMLPLATYLPQTNSGGSILITSRNTKVAFDLTNNFENLVDVPYMSKMDAVALLCKKLPHDRSSNVERCELVKLLEYLPLAITQAASYISVKRTRMTIAKYSDYLQKNADILLDDMGDLRRDTTIRNSVLLTWHISFDQINGENRAAAELLSLMSLFDRQGIPQYLLQEQGEDDLRFENRLAPLEEFSLITLEDGGQSFQMHRLVQMAIRSWLERHGETDRWKHIAAELIDYNLPGSDYKFWKTWDTLLPHSEVVLDYVFPGTDSQLLRARILHNTASYFEERGRYTEAKERCQRALDIRLDLLGDDDTETAWSLIRLAYLKKEHGYDRGLRIDETEAMARRAVGIFERVQGKDSMELRFARNSLALILPDTNDDRKLEEATEILRSILAFEEQSLGLEHAGTLVTMNNLANSLLKKHRYEEAEELHRRTLEISLRVRGEDHPGTIRSMRNLAEVAFNLDRYEEAQELGQRALDLRTRVLGEDHPDTVHAMDLVAAALHSLGKYEQSEKLYQKVYNNRPKNWDDGNWDRFLADFADTLAKQGKLDEAAEINRQKDFSEALASDNPEWTDREEEVQSRSASPSESPTEILGT